MLYEVITTTGTILGKIKEKFNISFTNKIPEGSICISRGLYDFNSPSTEAFKRLWVLEIAKSKNDPNTLSDFHKAYSIIERIIEKIEFLNIESISLPILGTGKQQIHYHEATRITSYNVCYTKLLRT